MEKPNPIKELNHVLATDNAILRPSLAPNSSRESSTIGLTNESITDADGASGNFYRINLQTSSADTRTKEDPSQQSAVTRDRFLDFEDVSHIIEFDGSSSKPESASAPSLTLNDQNPSLFVVAQPEIRKLQVQISEQETQLKQMEEQTLALKKENEALKAQNHLYQAQNEEKQDIINKLRCELSVSQKKRDILMKENTSLKRDVQGMKQIIDSKQHELEINKLMNKNNVMQQQMEQIKESYENKISGYMNLIDDLNSQILRIENQLQQQQRQSLHSFQALKDQNQTLEGQIALLQQQSSANSSVNKCSESFSLSSKPQSPKKKKKLPESSLNFLKQQILLSQSLIKSKVTQQQQKSKSKQIQQSFLNQTLPLPNNLSLSPMNDSNQKPCPSPLTDQYLHFILSNSLEKVQNLQEQKPLATSKKIINKNGQNKRSQSQQSQRSRSPISEFEDTQKLNMRNYDLNQQRNSMAQTLGRLDFEKILQKKTKRSSQNVPAQANTFSILQGKSPLNVPKSSKSFDKTSIKDIFLSNVHPRNSSALSSLSDARSNSLKGKTPVLDTRKVSQGSNEQRFNQTMGPKLNEANILVSPSPQIKWLPAHIPKQIFQSFEDTQHSIASSEFQISHDNAQKSLNGSLNSTLQFPLEVFSSQMKNSKPPKRSSSRNESSLNSSLNIPSSSQGTKQQLTDAHLFSMLTSCKNSGSCASSTRSSTDQYSTHHSSSFSTQKVLDQLAKFADPSLPKKQNLNKSLQHSQNKTHQISYEETPQSQMIDQQIVYVDQNPSISNFLGNTSTSNQLQSHFDLQQQQQYYPNFLQNPDDFNQKNNGKTNLNRTTVFSPLSSIQGDFLTLDDQNQAFMKMSTTSKNSSQSRVPSTKPINVPKVPKTKSNTASNNSSIANKFQPNKIMSVDDFCFSDVLSSKTRSNFDNTPLSQSSNACSTASSAPTQQPKPQIKLQTKQQFSKSQRKNSTSKPPYSGMIYDQQPYQQSFSFYEGSEMENSQSYCDVTNYLENHAMEGNNNSQSFEKEISQKNQAIANLSQAHFRSRSEQAQYKNSSGGGSKSSSRNGQNSNQTNKINSSNNSNKQSSKNSRNSNLKEF